MSKNIALLLGPNFSDAEYLATADTLQCAGHHLIHISPCLDQIIYGEKRTPVQLQQHLPDVCVLGIDGLMLFALEQHPWVSDFVQRVANAHKPIFSLSHATELLIAAKVAYGRCLTAAKDCQTRLTAAGAVYLDQAVVNDHNLYISNRSLADLPAFLQETLQVLRA